MPILHDAALIAIAQRGAVGLAIAAAIALAAYAFRALTLSGTIAALIVGGLSYAFGGVLVAASVIIFFIAGSVLGRVHSPNADRARERAPKDARRDAAQVLANGGVATVCAVAGGIAALHGSPHASRWMIAAVCAIAAAAGDTWSTEIGAFVPGPARLITNMQPVTAGTSGGVTLLGTLAAPFGGGLVGFAGLARPDILVLLGWLAIGAVAGFIGSVIDSILGATIQGLWRCSGCTQVVETPTHDACGAPCTLVRGLYWLDNDGVNCAMTLGGAALGYTVAALVA